MSLIKFDPDDRIVHVYVEMIVKVVNVKAESDFKAIQQAMEFVYRNPQQLEQVFFKPKKSMGLSSISFGDKTSGALIDYEGDETYEKSKFVSEEEYEEAEQAFDARDGNLDYGRGEVIGCHCPEEELRG